MFGREGSGAYRLFSWKLLIIVLKIILLGTACVSFRWLFFDASFCIQNYMLCFDWNLQLIDHPSPASAKFKNKRSSIPHSQFFFMVYSGTALPLPLPLPLYL
jgi:hypothetical protein